MRESNPSAFSSRRNRETARIAFGSTTTKGGFAPSCSSTTASPNFAFNASKMDFASTGFPLRRRVLAEVPAPADDLLELEDAVDERLGAGGAPRHVDVHGDDEVRPLHHAVGVAPEGA